MIGPLGRQALGDLEPVHRMHPVKVLGHQAGLVALNGANTVPLQSCTGQGSVHSCNLVHAFLDVVFAEVALAGGHGLQHRIGAKGLGNGQQGNAGRIAPGGFARLRHPAQNLLEVVSNRGHNVWQAYQTIEGFRGHYPTARVQRQEQGLRPAPLRRPAAHDPGPRRCAAHQRRCARPQDSPCHGVRHHERLAA
ncbi:hypothetical protein D3C71_1522020 [compost metagenome]